MIIVHYILLCGVTILIWCKKGSQIEAMDKDNNTPLHLAIIGGHSHIAELIVNQGSSTEALDKDGNSPLHLAVRSNNAGMVELFRPRRHRERLTSGPAFSEFSFNFH